MELSSFPRLRTEAPSLAVRERFATGVNPEAISTLKAVSFYFKVVLVVKTHPNWLASSSLS